MYDKVKVEPDAAPSSMTGTGGTVKLSRNRQKLREPVLLKIPRGMPPCITRFGMTCNGIKGQGLVFDSADLRADVFTHFKSKIAEYIDKEYTNGGDVWWTLEKENRRY